MEKENLILIETLKNKIKFLEKHIELLSIRPKNFKVKSKSKSKGIVKFDNEDDDRIIEF